MGKKDIAWDLSCFYKDARDPLIQKDMNELRERVEAFVRTYKGKIALQDMTGKTLFSMIKELEEIRLNADNLNEFAGLLIAANQTVKTSQELYNNVKAFYSEVNQSLAFVEIE